ncbi:YqjK family protein [Vreelandella olivaria]|uniref:YqjK family protein n=1 Tax=Vreelandella olivaria TaxID=390919 RepID=UPI00201F65FC|nr:YqjK family protein [Halomonas olivaria]
MTTPKAADRPLTRAERKAALLADLEQQRIDMLVDSDYLLRVTAPLDNHWRSLKLPLYAIGGVVAFRLMRRPGGVIAAGRKALAGYMLFRKFKLLAKATS